MFRYFFQILTVFLFLVTYVVGSVAQAQSYNVGENIQGNVRVIGSNVLLFEETRIVLWGVEDVEADRTVFDLKVRNALESHVGDGQVSCIVKKIYSNAVKAQCINAREEDLSLYLLQQGFVSADRAAIFGSVYQQPYLEAEKQAQKSNRGLWGEAFHLEGAGERQSRNFLVGASFFILVTLMGFGVLSFYIMRGFGRVVDIQNQAIDLAAKERSLKDKEKHIIASMITSEINENKTKIAAYLMVYEETLKDFERSDGTPKYKTSGEVIQKQPSLSRVVFDGNTHKLDLFGERLPSELIHYYARIKTTPDYDELKPDMDEEQALKIIKTAVENAQKMDKISDRILEHFKQQALLQALDV